MPAKTVQKRPAAAGRTAAKKARTAAPVPAKSKARDAAAPKEHKSKDSLIASWCKSVSSGIGAAEVLPESVREMLVDLLPTSLACYQNERHAYQQEWVDALGSVLAEVEKGIQAKIDHAEARVGGAEADKVGREEAVAQAQAELAKKQQEVSEKKAALADAAKAFRDAKEAVAEAVKAEEDSKHKLVCSSSNKVALESAVRDYARPLIEGRVEAAEAKNVVDKLLPVLRKFEFSDSMMVSLPMTLAKDPSARGVYDSLVLQQLHEELTRCAALLDAEIAGAEPAQQACAAAIKTAEQALDAARLEQRKSAAAFTATKTEEKACEGAVQAAKKVLKDLGPEVRAFVKAHEAAKKALHTFRSGPLDAYKVLKDRTPPAAVQEVPKPEAATEEAPPVPESATEGAAAAAEEATAPVEEATTAPVATDEA